MLDLFDRPEAKGASRREFKRRTRGENHIAPLLPPDFDAPTDYSWPEYVATARGEGWCVRPYQFAFPVEPFDGYLFTAAQHRHDHRAVRRVFVFFDYQEIPALYSGAGHALSDGADQEAPTAIPSFQKPGERVNVHR